MDGNNRVLIACPQHSSKEYAFQRWIDAVHQIPAEVLAVDNSENEDFYSRWKSQVRMVHIDLGSEPPNRRIALSMEFIRQYALGFDWWFSVESDVIVEPYTLDFMLRQAGDAEWVTLPYPSRKTGEMLDGSFGCCLFSRNLISRVGFSDAPGDQTTDGWFLNTFKPRQKILHCALVPKHLAERES